MEDIKENQSFVHLFSSASLTIAEEDWTHLVHSGILNGPSKSNSLKLSFTE